MGRAGDPPPVEILYFDAIRPCATGQGEAQLAQGAHGDEPGARGGNINHVVAPPGGESLPPLIPSPEDGGRSGSRGTSLLRDHGRALHGTRSIARGGEAGGARGRRRSRTSEAESQGGAPRIRG